MRVNKKDIEILVNNINNFHIKDSGYHIQCGQIYGLNWSIALFENDDSVKPIRSIGDFKHKRDAYHCLIGLAEFSYTLDYIKQNKTKD